MLAKKATLVKKKLTALRRPGKHLGSGGGAGTCGEGASCLPKGGKWAFVERGEMPERDFRLNRRKETPLR